MPISLLCRVHAWAVINWFSNCAITRIGLISISPGAFPYVCPNRLIMMCRSLHSACSFPTEMASWRHLCSSSTVPFSILCTMTNSTRSFAARVHLAAGSSTGAECIERFHWRQHWRLSFPDGRPAPSRSREVYPILIIINAHCNLLWLGRFRRHRHSSSAFLRLWSTNFLLKQIVISITQCKASSGASYRSFSWHYLFFLFASVLLLLFAAPFVFY